MEPRLELYVDESGTMPIGNELEPFVVVAVGELAGEGLLRGSRPLTKVEAREALERGALFGAAAVVMPRGEFGALHARKARAYTLLADLQRSVTGKNSEFVSSRGLNYRNVVYAKFATLAVSSSLLAAHLRGNEASCIDVICDQKSMSSETEALMVHRIGDDARLRRAVAEALPLHSPAHELIRENLLGKGLYETRTRWASGDAGTDEWVGLECADTVAKLVYQHFRAQMRGEASAERVDMWTAFSFPDTRVLLTEPIPHRFLLRWERETGINTLSIVPPELRGAAHPWTRV